MGLLDAETASLIATFVAAAAAVVATVGATVAAIFAVRTWRRLQRDLEPRLRVQFREEGVSLRAQIFNPGGAALSCWVLAMWGNGLYAWRGHFPEHAAQSLTHTFTAIAVAPTASSPRPEVLLSTVKDADGRPWDCIAAKRIHGAWHRWANAELARLGLAGRLEFFPQGGELELRVKAEAPIVG